MPDLRPGLYEEIVTSVLEDALVALADRAELLPLAEEEAPERLALHVFGLVEHSIASLREEDKVQVGTQLVRAMCGGDDVSSTARGGLPGQDPLSIADGSRSASAPHGVPQTPWQSDHAGDGGSQSVRSGWVGRFLRRRRCRPLRQRRHHLLDHCSRILVLPAAQHRPAQLLQLMRGLRVARPVGLDLGDPVLGVRLRGDVMLGAAVPEAAVDEHHHLGPGERDVCAAALVERQRQVDPVAQPAGVEQSADLPPTFSAAHSIAAKPSLARLQP